MNNLKNFYETNVLDRIIKDVEHLKDGIMLNEVDLKSRGICLELVEALYHISSLLEDAKSLKETIMDIESKISESKNDTTS